MTKRKNPEPVSTVSTPIDVAWVKTRLGMITADYEACVQDLRYQLDSCQPQRGLYNIHLPGTLRQMTSLLERISAHMEVIQAAEGKMV